MRALAVQTCGGVRQRCTHMARATQSRGNRTITTSSSESPVPHLRGRCASCMRVHACWLTAVAMDSRSVMSASHARSWVAASDARAWCTWRRDAFTPCSRRTCSAWVELRAPCPIATCRAIQRAVGVHYGRPIRSVQTRANTLHAQTLQLLNAPPPAATRPGAQPGPPTARSARTPRYAPPARARARTTG